MTDIVPLLSTATAIVGTTGAGKTYAARGAVETLLAQDRRVIIIDPTGVWWGLRSAPEGDENGSGYPVVIFGGEHADIAITDRDGKAIALAMATRQVQAIIDVSDMTGGERTRFLTDFLETLYAKNKSALHLVFDEADEAAPQNPMPETRRLGGVVDKIVRRGRVKGFRPLMITQRPAVLHKNVLSQIGTLIALKLTSPQDRKAIEGWVSGNADAGQSKEVMNSLPQLERGEGWVWSPAAGVLERQRFPSITTFDSGRTPDDGEVPVDPIMSWVDVEELRGELAIAPDPETAKSPGNMQKLSAEAEKRGYGAGFAAGIEHGKTVGISLGLTRARSALDALRVPEIATEVIPLVAQNRQVSIEEAKEQFPRAPTPLSDPGPHGRRRHGVQRAENKARASALNAITSGVPPAQYRILVALRQLEAIGQDAPEKVSIAWFAGASPKSSAFTNNLGAMRTAGLIDYPDKGRAALTDLGREKVPALGAPSHDEIMGLLADKLQPAQLRLLSALVWAWPGSMSKTDVAAATGASPKSSAFTNNCGRLRSLGLVTYPSAGEIRAADLLFPGERT